MSKEHYLKEELYSLIQTDTSIFEFIQAGSLDGIWYWDLERPEHEWMSPRFWEVLGYDPKEREHLVSEWQEIIFEDDLKVALENFHKHIEDPSHPYDQVVRYRHKNGTTVHIRCRGLAIRDESGKPIRMLGAHNDITAELKNRERRIRQTDAVLANTVEGILITDAEGIILDVNDAFTRITGWSKDEAVGKTPHILSSGWHDNDFYEKMWHALDNIGKWSGEIFDRRKSGEIYPQHIRIDSVRNELGEIENYVSVFSDVSQLKESEQEVYRLAHYDQLTGLANKNLLYARLEHTLSVNKGHEELTGVILIDIDNFKHVNDSYGHIVGDQVLIEVSKRLKSILTEEDTIARFGGDEFVVVITDFKEYSYLNHIAQKILRSLDKPIKIEHQSFHLTVSLGISVAPNDNENPIPLIKFADTAMHKAKEEGKNTCKFYDEKMTAAAFERIVIENAMNTAIEQSEFELYYQPKFDMRTCTCIGFEALIRWRHPTLGTVTPDRFIPIAEETKLIMPLGELVLNKACETIAKWGKMQLDVGNVAINVSGMQLEYSEFPKLLQDAIKRHGISAEALEIEITESSIMRDPERWIQVLKKISKMGVKISIDDFGTGYSSLSYLRKLSIDVLKIDRSFVMDLPHDQDACNIADTIIAMAQHMGMKIVAEGIETEAQYNYLKDRGCHIGQGYLYAKPMDEERTRLWLFEKQ